MKKTADGKSRSATGEPSMCITGPVLFIFSRKLLLIWRWTFNNWRIDWASHYKNTKFKTRKDSCSSHV